MNTNLKSERYKVYLFESMDKGWQGQFFTNDLFRRLKTFFAILFRLSFDSHQMSFIIYVTGEMPPFCDISNAFSQYNYYYRSRCFLAMNGHLTNYSMPKYYPRLIGISYICAFDVLHYTIAMYYITCNYRASRMGG